MNFNAEMIEQAKAAKSAEELLEIAKANGMEMTADEAETYFAQLNPKSGELDDDMLDGVAGGVVQLINPSSSRLGGSEGDITSFQDGRTCPKCGSGSMIITKVYTSQCTDRYDVACNACGNSMGTGFTSQTDINTK